MNLATLFEEKNIVMDVESQDRLEALAEVMQKIPHNGRLRNKEKALRDLIEREKLSSTAIGGLFAVPHVFTEEANLPTLVFARSKKGIEFNSLDQKPVHLLLLAFGHPRKKNFFIQCLYHAVQLLRDPEVFRQLMEANEPMDVLKAFECQGQRPAKHLFRPFSHCNGNGNGNGHHSGNGRKEHDTQSDPRVMVGQYLAKAAIEVEK